MINLVTRFCSTSTQREMIRIDTDTSFYRYFLNAQQEGHEVYVGREIVMVVYEKDRTIGFQASDNYHGVRAFSAVFLSFDELDDDERKTIEKIRKPSNRNGINENLTSALSDFYYRLTRYYDGFEPPEEQELMICDYSNQLKLNFGTY